jgi:hypothetical protein
VIRPALRRGLAENTVARHGVSIALACRTFDVSETCYRYSPLLSDENEEIADLLVGLTAARKTWGFGLCFLHLRNVQGHPWNHKRVYRIYCELELNLRIKPRKRLKLDKPEALAVPDAPNVTWSMDFMADRLGELPQRKYGSRRMVSLAGWTLSMLREGCVALALLRQMSFAARTVTSTVPNKSRRRFGLSFAGLFYLTYSGLNLESAWLISKHRVNSLN